MKNFISVLLDKLLLNSRVLITHTYAHLNMSKYKCYFIDVSEANISPALPGGARQFVVSRHNELPSRKAILRSDAISLARSKKSHNFLTILLKEGYIQRGYCTVTLYERTKQLRNE